MLPTTKSYARSALAAVIACLVPAVAVPDARACACCAEPGQRVESVSPMQPYEKTELDRLRFAKVAKLYLNAAGFDVVQGIRNPANRYDLVQTRQGNVWTFTLEDAKGNVGALSFSLPAKLESFFVDPRDSPAGTTDPVLYKEWRLVAPLTATGIFAPGAAGSPTVRFILHGRGNACTSADQFHGWTLEVSGPKASYRLFGALSAPASTP